MLKRFCRYILPPAVLMVALGAYSLAVRAIDSPQTPAARPTPWVVAPKHDEPLVASDAELLKVLERVQPPAKPANTNNYIHALRLWGPDATFDAPGTVSGEQLVAYFRSDAAYRKAAGWNTPPLFAWTGDGLLRARSFDDSLTNRATSSFHTDDLLATLAEIGTPLDAGIVLRDGQAQVNDLVQSALLDFHLSRHEYEWTIISYARYVLPQKRWQNKYGETITSDDLVDLLLERPSGIGPCNGLHRLEALVVLLRVDEKARGLSSKSRNKIARHLHEVSQTLVQGQASDGSWTRNWPQGAAGQVDKGSTVYDRLLVTGHHLEWMALAPAEVAPPRETIVRAARWTLKTILEISDEELEKHYGPLSHAARALCLWRGKEANEFWKSRPQSSSLAPMGADDAAAATTPPQPQPAAPPSGTTAQ